MNPLFQLRAIFCLQLGLSIILSASFASGERYAEAIVILCFGFFYVHALFFWRSLRS